MLFNEPGCVMFTDGYFDRYGASHRKSAGRPALAAPGHRIDTPVLSRQWNICLKMDGDATQDYDGKSENGAEVVKVICLGDSAVGKSKLLERFLLDKFKPQTISTYALTLYRYSSKVKENDVIVDFWDTAGQEMFQSMHPSYYHQAHACIMVFDATRKITYKNLERWYKELRQYRPHIPVFCAVNKIDANMDVTQQRFAFPEKNSIPLYYVSASNGMNVVKLFRDAIEAAMVYKKDPPDVTDQIFQELQRL